MDIVIRRARIEDAEPIARVDTASHVAAYAHIFDVSGYAAAAGAVVDRWRRILSGRGDPARVNSDVLVAVQVETVCGYVAFGRSRDEDGSGRGEIGAIYVDPARWRAGTGRLLMAAALDQLVRAGFQEATLWVLEANAIGRAFYDTEGWSPDGARRVANERVELRYRKRLV